jgi:hypothetical protein
MPEEPHHPNGQETGSPIWNVGDGEIDTNRYIVSVSIKITD